MGLFSFADISIAGLEARIPPTNWEEKGIMYSYV